MDLPLPLHLGSSQRQRAFACLAGALLVYVVLFWRLGDTSLWDPDEAHYAVTTVEMIASGNWLVPTFNAEPFFDKPIFFHWLQGASILAIGPTETAVRLGSAAAGLILIGFTGWFAATVSGRRVGFVAALLLAGNPSVFALARYAILDMVFVACLFGSATTLAVAVLYDRRHLQYLGWMLLGCATCIKGPVALVLCGLSALLAATMSGRVRSLRGSVMWVRGPLAAFSISFPWFAYMAWRFGRAFVDGYVLNENVRLFGRTVYTHQPGWWFYVGVVALAMLPWTAVVLGRAIDHCRGTLKRRASIDCVDVLMWSWIVTVMGFFSLSHFKLDHYVFPAAPALAIVCARAWEDVRTTSPTPQDVRWTRFGVRLIGPTLMISGVLLSILAMVRLNLPPAFLSVPVGVAAIGALGTVRYTRPHLANVPMLPLAAMGLIYVGALVWIVPKLEQGKVVPDLARWVQRHRQPGDRIATIHLDRWNPAFRFYVGQRVELLTTDTQARAFLHSPGPYLCVMTESSFNDWRREGVTMQVLYRREGMWATSGRALWRIRDPPTVFVVAAGVPQANK